MITVWIHPNIVRFSEGPAERCYDSDIETATLGEILRAVLADDEKLYFLIVDETGAVRRHINIFIGNENCKNLGGLAAKISDHTEIQIITAISGG